MVAGCDAIVESANGDSVRNGNSSSNSGSNNDNNANGSEMEVDDNDNNPANNLVVNNPSRFDKLICYGQGLQSMLIEMGEKDKNAKRLQDAFSLLAYSDPGPSPVGWQLEQCEREKVSSALNSAILESKSLPGHPPLEVALGHSKYLLRSMASNDLGACAFAHSMLQDSTTIPDA